MSTRALAALAATLPFLLAMSSAPSAQVSDLKADEVLIFYPSYLTWDARSQRWTGFVHGNVHEPAAGATAAAGLAAMRALVGAGRTLSADEARLFDERARRFLTDNERGKRTVLRIGTHTFVSDRSRPDGHFRVPVELESGTAGEEIAYETVVQPGDPRSFTGSLRLLAPDGVSVISDIDDTVKHTNVLDHSELLANTFLRPYRAIAGMPELYRAWGGQGVAVHWVTGSPWQLFPALWSFLSEQRFPGVEIQMRELRVKDASALRFLRSPRRYKEARLEEILRRFPGRAFVLVGDTGEDDPQIYASMARAFPDRVRAVFLRAVLDEHAARERYRDLFETLDESRWIVFRDPGALPPDLRAWLAEGVTDPRERAPTRRP